VAGIVLGFASRTGAARGPACRHRPGPDVDPCTLCPKDSRPKSTPISSRPRPTWDRMQTTNSASAAAGSSAPLQTCSAPRGGVQRADKPIPVVHGVDSYVAHRVTEQIKR
jgi:hypothetical protein